MLQPVEMSGVPTSIAPSSSDYCPQCGGTLRVHGDCIPCTSFDRAHRYLVVARDGACSWGLRDVLRRLADDDPDARFVLLIPSGDTAPEELGDYVDHARSFLLPWVNVLRTTAATGDAERAMADELEAHPNSYDAVVLSDEPPGREGCAMAVRPEIAARHGLSVIRAEIPAREEEDGALIVPVPSAN